MKITEVITVGNCVNSFDVESGVCVNSELPWADATEFAQAIEHMNTSSEIVDGIKIDYDEDTDIHWFSKE